MDRDLRTSIEVGVFVTVAYLIPGVLIVLAIDSFIAWLA